ncbi:Oidioi.mRNA.OKI2018_I69.chr2.g4888.t1.cds [Oikopleura dioica]|uniref:Oidioi.mRNA.OKI2018_I69.chr2.g4888.t1.cds n=1 Tax=Oikopleura dioica TaxID=34765 RepID=A0ABN7SYB3_OIKDI|nr:Oidioi.mRNA.OKI2018_I69.chr2.g4888.t1.cds [Oikopleura dioica]
MSEGTSMVTMRKDVAGGIVKVLTQNKQGKAVEFSKTGLEPMYYSLCVLNSFSMKRNMIEMAIEIKSDRCTGSAIWFIAMCLKTNEENLSDSEDETETFLSLLKNFKIKWLECFKIILASRAKHGYDEHLVQQNAEYIDNFSIIQSILLIIIPFIQVYVLKKMFVEKTVRV